MDVSRRIPAQMTVLSDGRFGVLARPSAPQYVHPTVGDDLIGERVVRVIHGPDGIPTDHEHDLRAVSDVYERDGWLVVRVADETDYYAAMVSDRPLPSGTAVPTGDLWVERRTSVGAGM